MDEEAGNRPVKHYKLALDPHFNASLMSERTQRTWEKAFKKLDEDVENVSMTQETQLGSINMMTNSINSMDTTDPNHDELIKDNNHDNIYTSAYFSDNEDEEVPEPKNTHVEEEGSREKPKDDKSYVIDDGNDEMFEQSKTTVNDVVEMVVAYCLRYGISQEGRAMLLEMFKICAGQRFQNLNLSNYKLSKIFDAPSDTITYHFYCDNCFKHVVHSSQKKNIKGQTCVCENCQKEHQIALSNPNYFVMNDLEYQIRTLLENDDIAQYFVNNYATENGEVNSINDVHNSILYKRTTELYSTNLTFNISTDGAPLFHVSKRGFWPLQISFNNLPPALRSKFILLAGIMIVKTEPKPDLINLYISEFIKKAIILHSEGIKVKLLNKNEEITIKFIALLVIADSIARAILQNRLQFNGYFGCSYCYQRGTYINGMKYPFLPQEPNLRTHESHMQDLQKVKVGSSFQGVKGFSVFINLLTIDMCWSFALDYMHNSILGVTEQIWNFWNKMLTPAQRKEIDDLLILQQPPRDLHRGTIKISNKSVWKATNWKAWILYFSLILCDNLIPSKYLEHCVLFVNSLFTCLKININEEELYQCERDLLTFVANYEKLFGPGSMTFNVHAVVHIPHTVKMSGPLWATSSFPFEHNIHSLKQTINGPKSVEQQMSIKSLNLLKYRARVPNDKVSGVVKDYIDALFTSKSFTQSALKVGNITFFGPDPMNVFDSVVEKEFERCIYQNRVYSSIKYLRSKKLNDTVVQLKNKEFVQITKICLLPDNSCTLYVKKLILVPFVVGETRVSHIWLVSGNRDYENVLLSDVESKAVVVHTEHKEYICAIPNAIEAQ